MRHAATLRRQIAGLTVALLCLFAIPALAQESAVQPQGLLAEPDIIERAVIFADRRQGNGEFTNGWYVDVWNASTHAGKRLAASTSRVALRAGD